MSGKTVTPTIADVAREANVSISTVSRIINGSTLVAGETLVRVQDAISRLGYQPRSAARSLALRRTNTLGILLEAIGTSFFSEVVWGAEEAAYEEGYSLLIATSNHMNTSSVPALGPFNTDGLMAVNITLTEAMTSFFNHSYPVVSLYNPAPGALNIPFVTIENKLGVFQLFEHLIVQHGLRRFGFLGGPEGSHDAYWREQGFREAMAKYDLPIDPDLVAPCGYNSIRAQDVLLTWHRNGILPQAIFTGSDDTALFVMLALHEMGLRVPEDVAVVGFDDSPLAANLVPPLTTVKAPTVEVGREGIRKLLQLIRNGATEAVTTLPTELVIRSSCGCSKSSKPARWQVISQPAREDAQSPS